MDIYEISFRSSPISRLKDIQVNCWIGDVFFYARKFLKPFEIGTEFFSDGCWVDVLEVVQDLVEYEIRIRKSSNKEVFIT